MHIVERLANWAQTMPERPAHISEQRVLTYGEWDRQATLLAGHLAQQLQGNGKPVVVWGHKEPELLIAFLGCIKAGHPYVPIDRGLPAQRVERIIATAGAELVLTPEQVRAWVAGPAPTQAPSRQLAPADPYYIMFTSGSTGDPKGVVITLACLTSFLHWMLAEQQFTEQDEVFLNQAPFSFDVSIMDIYFTLMTGGTMFSVTAGMVANPKQLYQALADANVTTWISTPSFAQLCLAEKKFNATMLPQVRRFLFCGETLPPDVALQLLERFPKAQVWNTYGPTEATVATTSVRIERALLQNYPTLPIGYPKPDTQMLILDEQHQPVARGERGEIAIVGPNVSPGYLGRPDLTERVFFRYAGQQAYRTGDVGYYQDGLLFFEGRADQQVKLHGYRIELGDIEANLCQLGQVRGAAVLPVLKEGKVDALAAFVILHEPPPGQAPASDFEQAMALRTALAERLPAYMLPRKFYFLAAFPMTINGKIDRRQLANTLL